MPTGLKRVGRKIRAMFSREWLQIVSTENREPFEDNDDYRFYEPDFEGDYA